jgi:hypothetical protein
MACLPPLDGPPPPPPTHPDRLARLDGAHAARPPPPPPSLLGAAFFDDLPITNSVPFFARHPVRPGQS